MINPLLQKAISEVEAVFVQSYHGYWKGEKKNDPLRRLKETYVFIILVNMIVV